MDLFIVESPGKVKKIQGYLGNQFKVAASVGHIRDLPAKSMGINFGDWKIQYELTDKGKGVFKKMNALAKNANKIYLATDLDREGEAIAWHLAVMLRIPPEKILRVKYNAITRDAVINAIRNPERLDMNLVRAQEARRAIDRLVGYTVSPAVSRSLNQRLSAGRVQSVAVRLITDRWRDNQNFVPQDYFGATLDFAGFSADWNSKPYLQDGEKYNFDRDLASNAASVEQIKVVAVESKKTTKKPPAPFTTSTMQQTAVKKLGMDTELVMKLAQELYEASLITYHRTDSVELSPEAVHSIREYASSQGLPVPETPNSFKSKSGAQEAHEAVRPVDIQNQSVSGVSSQASELYELIHRQALLSQLKPASLIKKTVTLQSIDERFEYLAKGSTVIDKGYLVVDGASDDVILPEMSEGDCLDVIEGHIKEQKTKAPPLFDEASLLNELERLGIGRPSTWASIIKVIKIRKYIALSKKKFVPTETGQTLRNALDGFAFLEYDFTDGIEEQMDAIARGEDNYKSCVTRVFNTVLEDMRTHFDYEGDGESFFVPAEKRDYQPSQKQIDAVNRMADALGLEVNDVNLDSGLAVSEFLEKNYAAYKLTFKPSEKQISYAEEIADAVGVELDDVTKSSAVKLSAFIEQYKKAMLAKKPPSDKQKAFAEKIANENGVDLPGDYAVNSVVCSEFIDKHMGGSKKKRRPKKKA